MGATQKRLEIEGGGAFEVSKVGDIFHHQGSGRRHYGEAKPWAYSLAAGTNRQLSDSAKGNQRGQSGRH